MHKRQIYTSFLTCDTAKSTGNNSYLVWGVTNVVNEEDIDPNYLLEKHFKYSPFHQALHQWALINQGYPLFHVDIHGKMNRPNNCEIDVGIKSMEVLWEGDPLVTKIRSFFAKEGNVFEGLKFKGFPCTFNTEPYLHGFWGDKIHTMTEQAILLGIPSMQLEIPYAVRKKLFKDVELRGRFQKLIRKLFDTVILPDYKESNRKLKIDPKIAEMYVHSASIKGEKEREEVLVQLNRWQAKEEASDPNEKKCI